MHPEASADEARLRPIADLTLQVARPLCWHDARQPWPKRLVGATCFVLRLDSGLVGVTANHVIAALEKDRGESDRFVGLLRTAVLDWPAVLIDRDERFDIATFRVTEAQLAESGGVAIDCRGRWPPPDPQEGDALTIAGYPEILQVVAPHDAYPFHGYVHFTRVESVTAGTIVAIYEPKRGDYRLRASAVLPDVGGNFSGCSGGPVLLHVEEKGLHRVHPVGLVVAGPSGAPHGLFDGVDVFQFRRLDAIQADGTLRRLPP